MPKSRRPKVSKPRENKRKAIRRNRKQVRVVPNRLLGWKVTYGSDEFRISRKVDAVSLGTLVAGLASCEFSVSLYVHKRNGEIEEERTYTRADDPTSSPG